MTKEEKTAWLQAASPEALLKQFESASKSMERLFEHPWRTADEIIEDYDLVKAEMLRRLSK